MVDGVKMVKLMMTKKGIGDGGGGGLSFKNSKQLINQMDVYILR